MYYMQNSVAGDDASLLLCRSIGDATNDGRIEVEQPSSSLDKNPSYVCDVSELFPVTLKLRLESCGNPDYGQDPERRLMGVTGSFVVVDTLEEAQVKCRAFIDDNELGSGNWAGGLVFANDHPIAYVSYNGRLWTGETERFKNAHQQLESAEPLI